MTNTNVDRLVEALNAMILKHDFGSQFTRPLIDIQDGFKAVVATALSQARQEGRREAVEHIERNCPKIKNIQAFDGNLYVKIDNMSEDPSFMLLPESVLTSALTTEGK